MKRIRFLILILIAFVAIAGLVPAAQLALAGQVDQQDTDLPEVAIGSPVSKKERPNLPEPPDMSHKGEYPENYKSALTTEDNYPSPKQAPGTANRGWWLDTPSNGLPLQGGVTARIATSRIFDIMPTHYGIADRETVLYAPTHYIHNACLEMVNVGYHALGWTTYGHGIGFYDWCGTQPGGDGTGGWQVQWYWNTAKLARYAFFDTAYNQEMYFASFSKVSSSPNCWEGYLWAVPINSYELIARSCTSLPGGNPTVGDGWTMFETYGFATDGGAKFCPPVPAGDPVRAAEMQVWTGTQWQFMAAADHSEQMNQQASVSTGPCFSVSGEASPYYWRNQNRFGSTSNMDWKVGNNGP